MGIEFELKFGAEPEQLERIAQAFDLDYQTVRMETTYYDTRDGKLSEHHVTLRRRMENDRSVCTVKTPVSGYGRGEWECDCDRIEDAIDILCELGAPRQLLFLTAEGVSPVCGARFIRRCGRMDVGGISVELALDRGVLLGGGREVPLCEVEVELKAGQPEAAVAFAENLAEEFGLRPERKSKFRRALALAKGE